MCTNTCVAFLIYYQEGNDDNIKKVFEQLDTDKDGLIGKQELIEFMQK